MAPTDLRYTYLAKGRYWRFRHPVTGDLPLPRIKGLPTAEQPHQAAFMARYSELLARVESGKAEEEAKAAEPTDRSSWRYVIGRYRKSAEFRALADDTQLDYGKTLDLLDEHLGNQPFRLTTPAMIKAVRDDYAATPRKAHKIKQMASALYTWAQGENIVPEGFNPAMKLKRLRTKGGVKEYTCWSPPEHDAFMVGAIEPMQIAAMIARYTGQRARDIPRMVWTDFQGELIRVRQSKTGQPLMIACHSTLRAYLEALRRRLDSEGRRGALILTNANGEAYTANSLGSAIYRDNVRLAKAGKMPRGRSIHGLRYMAGAELEEAGATVGEIEAVLGHQTMKMAMKYATQRRRARQAIDKMEAANGPA